LYSIRLCIAETVSLQVVAYLAKVPCFCRFQVAAVTLLEATALPTGNLAAYILNLPKEYNCPNTTGSFDCTPTAGPRVSHPFSIPNLPWASKHYAPRHGTAFSDPSLSKAGNRLWWTKEKKVLDSESDRNLR